MVIPVVPVFLDPSDHVVVELVRQLLRGERLGQQGGAALGEARLKVTAKGTNGIINKYLLVLRHFDEEIGKTPGDLLDLRVESLHLAPHSLDLARQLGALPRHALDVVARVEQHARLK